MISGIGESCIARFAISVMNFSSKVDLARTCQGSANLKRSESANDVAGHLDHSISQRIDGIEVKQVVDRVLEPLLANCFNKWARGMATSVQAQPSSFSAIPECQI